jgi:hypothetical protein
MEDRDEDEVGRGWSRGVEVQFGCDTLPRSPGEQLWTLNHRLTLFGIGSRLWQGGKMFTA